MKELKKYLKVTVCVVSVLVIIVVILKTGIMSNIIITKDVTKSFRKEKETYTLTTDLMYKTMQDDGGSHTSQYYIIDFKDKVATKYEDCYVGFKGYKYQRKLLYSKSLNNSEIESLKKLIEKVEENKHKKMNLEESNYLYYSLYLQDGEKVNFNDYDIIYEMEEILNSSK